MKTITCNGILISLDIPKIMGIVNATPDSFYSQSRITEHNILNQVEQMLHDGATFIDIGGYSSRPNAENVSQSEEIKRVIPLIEKIIRAFPSVFISVDTFRGEVARQAIKAGACIVNDISAGEADPTMWDIVTSYQVPYIAMHMRGTPQTMQQFTQYNHLVKDIIYYFSQITQKAHARGINDLIIDPGFGFSKTLEQNYSLMKNLDAFHILEKPLLVGISRKSMLYKLLESSPEESLNGTSALNTIALLKGADILRVHDVKQAMECVKIIQTMNL
ncbi:dihydropteroate synthase [Capnocytophaga catalasegens]|uniref:dihydropteroate synthase n=1 Tax=Capnocytophaga catalasegens TaxID=1004260 RepID=A0AAV5AZW9_9FLAO|nr:dihydropteroate synthase [Capnocytophaga catalasegens]GIZ16310.1 dihydropteroate synthase [Capnocytophaga catalasegens]GJM50542.1 dihydropteroate synthase [Capnocytophaga catalasegens]GJM53221.1 dihydropteroate synthase [Capnocytophaga catalasegens]